MRILPPIIKDELDRTGLSWEIEKGTRHYHIRINGSLVGILPKGGKCGDIRTMKNCISQIRKAAKGIKWSSYRSAQPQIVP